MSKESPVSVGNDAYVDLDRQVSSLRCFFSFDHSTSVAIITASFFFFSLIIKGCCGKVK